MWANSLFGTGISVGDRHLARPVPACHGNSRGPPTLAAAVNGVTPIANLHQLALLGVNYTANYALVRDIAASETASGNASGVWSSAGWVPLGDSNWAFTGVFDGQGHSITGLTINRPDDEFVGLFRLVGMYGHGGTISNLGLVGGSVTGGSDVGMLAGFSYYTTVSNVYATGDVSGVDYVGGLLGYANGATIRDSHVTGNAFAGGLVGSGYESRLSNVYATGDVSVGGLIGSTYKAVLDSAYATGKVIGGDQTGGLIGTDRNDTITNVYASGNVTGGSYVGGLLGYGSDSNITNAYATGDVRGGGYVGGLFNYGSDANTTNAYAVGRVTGSNNLGAGPAHSGTENVDSENPPPLLACRHRCAAGGGRRAGGAADAGHRADLVGRRGHLVAGNPWRLAGRLRRPIPQAQLRRDAGAGGPAEPPARARRRAAPDRRGNRWHPVAAVRAGAGAGGNAQGRRSARRPAPAVQHLPARRLRGARAF
jgi:hypothetical protein